MMLRTQMDPDRHDKRPPSESIPNFDEVNRSQFLYLRNCSEPSDNALRLIVEEAASDRASPESSPAERSASQYLQIRRTGKTFALRWKHYVAYLVTEEGAGSCGEYSDEVYTGKLLRHYTKSHFLDHLGRDTGGHMNPLRHYKVICLNHLIDVASENPPEIELVQGI